MCSGCSKQKENALASVFKNAENIFKQINMLKVMILVKDPWCKIIFISFLFTDMQVHI